MLTQEQIDALRAPFPTEEIHWRAGATSKEGNRAMALAYIDARAVMDRLDEVIGPMSWSESYEEWKSGAVKASIAIRDSETGEWIVKSDGADDTAFEATKGGFSDSFKRAGVKWGIARYLYRLPTIWVACQKRGNTVKLLETPSLPAWALPEGHRPTETVTQALDVVTPSETVQEGTEEATAPAFWRLANQALEMGVPYTRVRQIAQAANGDRWAGAMDALRSEMVAAG